MQSMPGSGQSLRAIWGGRRRIAFLQSAGEASMIF
jgi:hypothetical protein